MSGKFWNFWQQCRPAFSQKRCWERAGRLALGILLNMGRHTVSRSISAIGDEQRDWSALYRLFERNRIDLSKVQKCILDHLMKKEKAKAPLLAFIDDTLLKKRGKKVSGTSWKLDPLGPKFTHNFVWAQRYMQISLGFREKDNHCRGIPVLFKHCPVPRKPGKFASPEAFPEYKAQQKQHRLPVRAAACMEELQSRLPEDLQTIFIGDGGYSNRTVIDAVKRINCYIGRIRKNSKLFSIPETQNTGKGRKRYYGSALPSPEDIRLDDFGWQNVKASTGNGEHSFKIKSISPVRSKITGGNNIKILIVQPLRYRLSQKTRLLYRDPAYLNCTDPQIPDAEILQYYLWRWEIEVNFKDEKTIFGIHEPQVRTVNAVESLPEFSALIYALFLLASKETFGDDNRFSYPKWRSPKTVWRPSTANYLAAFRTDILTQGANKSGFDASLKENAMPLLFKPAWQTVIYNAAR